MDNADAPAKHPLLVDCAFLYRDDPTIGRILSALSPSTDAANGTPPSEFVAVPARAADFADIWAMAERHEGPASVKLVAHWLKRQPHSLLSLSRGARPAAVFVMRPTACGHDVHP